MNEELAKQHVLEYFNGDQLAADVWWNKYRLETDGISEIHPLEMFKRCAREIAAKESEMLAPALERFKDKKIPNLSQFGDKYFKELTQFLSDNNEHHFTKTIYDTYEDMLMNFDGAVLGGSMYSGIGNKAAYQSLSNCFVLGQPFDSYAGIISKEHEIIQVEKRRGGAGIDLSTIRPEMAEVHNQSKYACGPLLYLNRYSNATREVSQNGRRGALMASIRVAHPDSLQIVNAKRDKTKITGANVSIIISDEFMDCVLTEQDYIQRFPVTLQVPKHLDIDSMEYDKLIYDENSQGYFRKINAHNFWNEIVRANYECAEPGIMWEGTFVNYSTDGVYPQFRYVTSNPCFSGHTPLLTDKGYFPIETLVDTTVNVWNGVQWSAVTPKVTGTDQEMVEVALSDGTVFENTLYHKYPVWKNGKEIMVEASNLNVGDKLSKFELSPIEYGGILENGVMYSNGFYSGDGTTQYNSTRLYGDKIKLVDKLIGGVISNETKSNFYGTDYIDFGFSCELFGKNFVPINNYSIKSRLEWLSGLIDADGSLDKNTGSCQIGSTNNKFLCDVKLMLTTLGIHSKINVDPRSGMRDLPDQKGGSVSVMCKVCYRLLINSKSMCKLVGMGLETYRVKCIGFSPNRDASRFVTVKSVTPIENADKVYCFNEPFRHKAVFNGILLGQCGEIGMGEYDACRLLALNLFACVDKPFTVEAGIDFVKLYENSYKQMLMANSIIDLEVDYIKNIIDKIERTSGEQDLMEFEKSVWMKILNVCQQGRRCGCGFLGLGDMLAAIGEPYADSPIVEKVMQTKMKSELDCTIDLAIIYKPFDGWLHSAEFNDMFDMIEHTFPDQYQRMALYGRRNVSWSTLAPTGSGGIISQLTGGIEPLFMPFYKRRKKCMVPTDRVDYVDVDGEKFTEYFVIHPKLKMFSEIAFDYTNWDSVTENTLQNMYELSPYHNNCAGDIPHNVRVDMQALIQKYTTHSISSTINLPKDVKVDVIDSIYRSAYTKGLKGVTVYRDGSRGGIMVSNNNEDKSTWFEEVKAPKRPDKIEADLHLIRYNSDVYCVIVGLFNGKPYECFVCYVKEMPDLKYPLKGEIVKRGTDRYCFYSEELDINDIQNCDSDTKIFGLMVSTMLRHRIPLKKIAKTFRKSEMLISDFSNKILHVLTKYIPDGEVDDFCEDCWEKDKIKVKMTYQGGCCMCPNGHSKC